MATKSDLITTLVGIYTQVCNPELSRTDTWNGLEKKTYAVNVLKTNGNLGKFFNITFYVLSEGQPGEVAYFNLDNAPAELQV
jgi:hypothetical protein